MKATFSGSRPFPLEMLRNDCCYPSDMSDVMSIIQSIRKDIIAPEEAWKVTVTKASPNTAFAIEKWKQLGWKLEKIYIS